MITPFKCAVFSAFIATALAACGDGGDLDFSIRFAGTLAGPAGPQGAPVSQPIIGRVCALGECGVSSATGQFSFKAYDNFPGGTVQISVTIDGVDSAATVELPKQVDDVRLALLVDDTQRNLMVASVEVLNRK